MNIDLTNYTDRNIVGYKKKFNYLANKTLKILKLKDNFLIEVDIVDDDTIHQMNKEYRNKDRVTDVISFAFNDPINGEIKLKNAEINFLGSVTIDYFQAKRQARSLKQSVKKEVCFLFVHGLLHLLGYDHMTEKDEEIMFGLQRKIFEGEEF